MATETLRPNAPGDDCEFKREVGAACPNHYQNVDEESADDATTVVKGYLADTQDLYNIENSGVGTGTINKVTVHWRSMWYTSSRLKGRHGIKSGATEDWGTGWTVLTGTFTDYSREFVTDPNTGSAWTWAAINALQVGVKITSVSGCGLKCTQIYVEVDYTPAALYHHGLKVQGVGELALCDVDSHPLRIRKGGTTYGIELVAIDDPNASRIRIKTPSGVKAIRKYT